MHADADAHMRLGDESDDAHVVRVETKSVQFRGTLQIPQLHRAIYKMVHKFSPVNLCNGAFEWHHESSRLEISTTFFRTYNFCNLHIAVFCFHYNLHLGLVKLTLTWPYGLARDRIGTPVCINIASEKNIGKFWCEMPWCQISWNPYKHLPLLPVSSMFSLASVVRTARECPSRVCVRQIVLPLRSPILAAIIRPSLLTNVNI